MPHDDEMSANIKEIEKLFGTHIKLLNVYDDESHKFSMFPVYYLKLSSLRHPPLSSSLVSAAGIKRYNYQNMSKL